MNKYKVLEYSGTGYYLTFEVEANSEIEVYYKMRANGVRAVMYSLLEDFNKDLAWYISKNNVTEDIYETTKSFKQVV
ncbi:hypothetical protein [Psychrobacillus phage Perkons]|nr:hypothetical protein [Psychrobacillus phage Perkons]